ncbi:hypothetical protein [Neisseria sp. Marseille-Q6792]|uniref:hypothetical protein n=1 Tax=Neisseria sp. Marseille-Q6792 TaxID=2937985 RepID=UPI00202447A1|nr:hypothetical protein [Neisseria sp. Marseille-Q6792]
MPSEACSDGIFQVPALMFRSDHSIRCPMSFKLEYRDKYLAAADEHLKTKGIH